MNLNINDEMFTQHRIEAFRPGHNIILQKIFKFTAIIVGIMLIVSITYDLGEKIIRTYDNKDDNLYHEIRNLEINNKNEENENKFGYMLNNTQISEYIKEHEANKKLISEFLSLVDRRTFKGKWTMNRGEDNFNFLSDRTEGEMAFRIERLITYSPLSHEKVFIVFRLLDGHYIDRWVLVRSVNSPFSNISISNTSLTQNFNSYVDFGEIFERIDLIGNVSATCNASLNIDWGFNNNPNNTDTNIENLIGSFSSDCGFGNFRFILKVEDEDEDYHKVTLYSIVVTILAVSQIFNSLWLTYKTTNSQTFANSISMITILQNIVWNAYGCLCHFFLTVNYDFYSLHFGVPAFLYFANFSIFELKLLYSIWRIKNSRYANEPAILRKKLIQFYFLFYVIMFFSLFYVMKFYFEKPYIFFATIATWIPQIVSNVITKNKTSMPILNILLISLNKVFLPFYFRGCPENFFQLTNDSSFINLCIFCLLAEIAFMYSQTIFGPRWFLPKSYNTSRFNFYKSRSDILLIRPDAEFHDCVICLFSLMNNESFKHFSDDFIAAGDESVGKNKFSKIVSNSWIYFTEFHEIEYNVNKKPFMMTPCRHYFHTQCLESWFKQKKECPSCRQDIDDTLI